ncbi:sensor histidine kinase [Paraburkholderia xenovorans]|uniref:sensor histidine kinase n=1 Tax=Paraburkholderia xenovorans TaxID=36873 RepID=UPI0015586605|nr:sensor histidine kinase [Paraburkholderia xenovorans]NPT32899.1 hypothetical protein [Paraburkholderia xenovorans]
MAFTFKARVLLELGAELISSDAVAVYELAKNAIDAGSKELRFEVSITLQHSKYRLLCDWLDDHATNYDLEAFTAKVDSLVEPDAPARMRAKFYDALAEPETPAAARVALDEAYLAGNKIVIADKGHGMTRHALRECYLTVGTPMRLLQKQTPKMTGQADNPGASAPVLGEKGIGRLAAMRLGRSVHVRTSDPEGARARMQIPAAERGEPENPALWNVLRLDYRPIFADPNLGIEDVDFKPAFGGTKSDPEASGTTLTIRDLQSDWDLEKLESLTNSQLVKLADPFASSFATRFFLLKLQDEVVEFGKFESMKLKHSDVECTISFREREQQASNSQDWTPMELVVDVNYKRFGKRQVFPFSGDHLKSCITLAPTRGKRPKADDPLPANDAVEGGLRRLGPFEAKFWWFNRGRIQREDKDLWSALKPFVANWSGGLLVYRDGFRVYPYGAQGDDWLDLDRNALSASRYRLNRAQIVGYLRIAHDTNPALQDQTNREGFRDCVEKEALRRLLRHVFINVCRPFLERIDNEEREEDLGSIDKIEARMSESQRDAVGMLKNLQRELPEQDSNIREIIYQLGEIQDAWERAKLTIAAQEQEMEQYVDLAGRGLQVEFIAHEMARVTANILNLLKGDKPLESAAVKGMLEAQVKTLEKKIRNLDVYSIPGRQRRTGTDVVELVKAFQEVHADKVTRHNIEFKVSGLEKPLLAKVEKGQILNILDNLFANSFYWLKTRSDRSMRPSIQVVVDAQERTLTFHDNGPGIPTTLVPQLFVPFMTTKPPGEGRGLGLYISRKFASYNDATLELGPVSTDGVHHAFVLSFKNTPKK